MLELNPPGRRSGLFPSDVVMDDAPATLHIVVLVLCGLREPFLLVGLDYCLMIRFIQALLVMRVLSEAYDDARTNQKK